MRKECSICKEEFDFVYEKGEQLPQYFPFCSSRCKQVDLARWLNEKYQISSSIIHDELTTNEAEETVNFLRDATNGNYTHDESKD